MAKLPNIAIDPYLLCIPNPCLSYNELDNFINGLLAWQQVLLQQNIHILLSEQCIAALYSDNQYPYRHQLQHLIEQFEIDYADVETVSRVAHGIINNLPTLEEHTGIACLLFEEDKLEVRPDFYLRRLGPSLRKAQAEALAMLAYHYGTRNENQDECIVATTCFSENEIVDLEVHSEIDVIEWHTNHPSSNLNLPVKCSYVFGVLHRYDMLLRKIGCIELWGNAENEQQAIDAIHLIVNELLQLGATEFSKLKQYRLGTKFLNSVRQNNFHRRADWLHVLIESCARIIANCPKNEIIPFRSDDNPQSQQLQRDDGAVAWRTHLTKHNEGFRLMFWETADGIIEFANVGVKYELKIL